MGRIKVLENVIQHYAWGSLTAIPELLDIPPSPNLPCAELWMGAHPAAPSRVRHQGRMVPLDTFIRNHPDEILGPEIAGTFEKTLPFLFKVLAAARPLSLQAHPDDRQAASGFSRENRAGIPLDAPERNYKDARHKPECLCALTPFSALCGFRDLSETVRHFSSFLAGRHEPFLAALENDRRAGDLKSFFRRLCNLSPETAREIVARSVDYAEKRAGEEPMYRWVRRLHQDYPDDIMVLAPVFLNLVELAPHQAVFIPAGVLHSYLEGVGVELMANSDNVLRGGLTKKHIDVDELFASLRFSPMTPEVLSPVYEERCEAIYKTKAREFVLSRIRVLPDQVCAQAHQGRVAILLCLEGTVLATESDTGQSIRLGKGLSALVPAAVEAYTLSGDGLLFKAAVPI